MEAAVFHDHATRVTAEQLPRLACRDKVPLAVEQFAQQEIAVRTAADRISPGQLGPGVRHPRWKGS